MKAISSKKLASNAKKHNRKRSKKTLKAILSHLNKYLYTLSKEGKSIYSKSFDRDVVNFREFGIVFRWLRMHSDLSVKIIEHTDKTCGRRYLDSFEVTIYW